MRPSESDLSNTVDGRWLVARAGEIGRALASRFSLRNRHVFLADCLVVPVGALLAFAIRFDGLDAEYLHYLLPSLFFVGLAPIVRLPVLRGMGMYAQAWRYAGRREALVLGWSVLISSAILSALMFFIFAPDGIWGLVTGKGSPGFPRAVLLIDALLSLNLLGAVRLAAKVLSVSSLDNGAARFLHTPSPTKRRVLLVGAGDAGAAIAAEMRSNPGLGLVPIGFVDDDPNKKGVFVQGVRVLGTRQDIPALVHRYDAEEVLMTLPTAPGWVVRDTVTLCQQVGASYRTVPGIYELINGSVSVRQSREVQIEDLLRREPVELDTTAIAGYLGGARVLVTGAGGSIGTELCRQIGRFSPELLVLLGHGENSIYHLEMDLRRRLPHLAVAPVVGDVRDADRMRAVMMQFQPTVIFHAAAHKHVPLMEGQAQEVITNNVLGTRTVLREAERAGVSRFVLVSTDKAADPVNLMGATKRMAEMLVCDAAQRTGRAYAAVRFGNVLGSRGSVIPLFLSQIAAGGPITVTHPDVIRYFMTIPEAAQLIIQAGARSLGGEVFILDMGEPIKIVDLAADLVRLSGLRLGHDIDIAYTGLRPGEKICEVLLTGTEEFTAERHQGFMVARIAQVAGVDRHIMALEEMAKEGNSEQVVTKLWEILAEFEAAQASSGLSDWARSYSMPTVSSLLQVAGQSAGNLTPALSLQPEAER